MFSIIGLILVDPKDMKSTAPFLLILSPPFPHNSERNPLEPVLKEIPSAIPGSPGHRVDMWASPSSSSSEPMANAMLILSARGGP